MTLIISAFWRRWAFHASDRFVSVPVSRQNPTGEFDPHSNKSVAVVGTNCWVVMGYTGIAYLNGRPTDQLIAEAISGYDDLSGAMSTLWFPVKLHYREIRNRIESTLSDAYSRLSARDKDAHGLTVLASGLQRKGNGIKRVMFRIDITKTGTTSAELAQRFMPWNTMQVTAAGTVHFPTMNRMGERLKTCVDNPDDGDPRMFREIMMDAVRETGEIVPTKVGRDAVGVYLEIFKPNPKISAHFHPKNYERLSTAAVDRGH